LICCLFSCSICSHPVDNPDGTFRRYHYGIHENLIYHNITDENRHRTYSMYDTLGRRVKVRELSGDCGNYWGEYVCGGSFVTEWANYATTTYSYSPLDLLERVTDQHGNVTTMSYDSSGRKTAMTDPDMGGWSYRYDVNGNLRFQTDAKGQTTEFRYDPLDRLTAKIKPDGWASYYGYDEGYGSGKGQRTSMSAWYNGVQQSYSSFYHDARGRVYNQGNIVAGMSGAWHIAWTHDSADRVATMTYPTGEQITYSYDPAGRQTSVCTAGGGCYASNAQYTALDQPTQRTVSNGATQYWNYSSPTQRLARTYIGGVSPSQFDRSYSYDGVGNVKTIRDNVAGQTQHFGYDHRDRLTNAWTTESTTNAYTEGYSYDAIGNLTSKAGVGYSYGTQSASCAAGALTKPHAVVTRGMGTFCYDANGNLVSGGGRTISWNADNQPTRVAQTGLSEDYSYDADGERITRTVNGTQSEQLLSRNKATTASSQQTSQPAARAVDGDSTTNWVATTGSYPQWWQVDLGQSYALTKLVTSFPTGSNRVFKYKVEVSSDNTTWTQVADRSNNTTVGTVTDTFTATARYVRITITGCTVSGCYAGITEADVYGLVGNAATTTVYVGGVYEEDLQSGTTRVQYHFNGQAIAQRENGVLTYLYADHLGSISVASNEQGTSYTKQDFTPWGELRSGGISQTTLNYTGQRRDGTGLLYYHARYYDPTTARFLSADSVVPDVQDGAYGAPDGTLTPLTVDFHEPSFLERVTDEHALVLSKGLLAEETRHAGPEDAQALNRYSYVGNNPLGYTDPDGHVKCSRCAEAGGGGGGGGCPACGGSGGSSSSGGGGGYDAGGKPRSARVYDEVKNPFATGKTPKASDIARWAEHQGWTKTQTANGPIKYVDKNGVVRVTLKQGSLRTPGSGSPHVELRDATGQRISPSGNPVTRRPPDNHSPIDWDLP
jgi:RHS repeat-associated protein